MNKRLAIALFMMVMMPAFLSAAEAADNVVISEVLYDPLSTETGGEAIELYNPTRSAVDISGWKIATESSATDATIPTGTVLAAKTYYLVADNGWSTSRDDASWPEADHEEAITMSNSDAGVALVAANGTTIDAVGWGDAAGIGAGLYEGVPATPVVPGNSLSRIDAESDSNDNSADLVEGLPSPQNSSTTTAQAEGEQLTIGVEVENNAPQIQTVSVDNDEDDTTDGVQVIPVPGGYKDVVLAAVVTDLDSEPTVTATVNGLTATLSKAEQLNSTTAMYNGTVQMEFHDAAGTYDIVIVAEDGSANSTMNTSFDYLSMAAISIDASSLQFSGASLGGTAEINGDFALSTTDSPSVRNVGNTELDIGLYGTDLTDGAKSIGISNVKYSFDNDFDGGMSGVLSVEMQIQSLGLVNGADSVTSLGFQLFVPANTQNGNYTSQITIVAVSS